MLGGLYSISTIHVMYSHVLYTGPPTILPSVCRSIHLMDGLVWYADGGGHMLAPGQASEKSDLPGSPALHWTGVTMMDSDAQGRAGGEQDNALSGQGCNSFAITVHLPMSRLR
jgi:hypothetical protein